MNFKFNIGTKHSRKITVPKLSNLSFFVQRNKKNIILTCSLSRICIRYFLLSQKKWFDVIFKTKNYFQMYNFLIYNEANLK